MKKLIMGSIALFLFSASIMMFQMSCKKDAIAQTANTASQIGKIIYGKAVASPAQGFQVWIANYDGSDAHQIAIAVPANSYISSAPKVSPDGKTLFFNTEYITKDTPGSPNYAIYSCNIDGSGVKQLTTNSNTLSIGSAY